MFEIWLIEISHDNFVIRFLKYKWRGLNERSKEAFLKKGNTLFECRLCFSSLQWVHSWRDQNAHLKTFSKISRHSVRCHILSEISESSRFTKHPFPGSRTTTTNTKFIWWIKKTINFQTFCSYRAQTRRWLHRTHTYAWDLLSVYFERGECEKWPLWNIWQSACFLVLCIWWNRLLIYLTTYLNGRRYGAEDICRCITQTFTFFIQHTNTTLKIKRRNTFILSFRIDSYFFRDLPMSFFTFPLICENHNLNSQGSINPALAFIVHLIHFILNVDFVILVRIGYIWQLHSDLTSLFEWINLVPVRFLVNATTSASRVPSIHRSIRISIIFPIPWQMMTRVAVIPATRLLTVMRMKSLIQVASSNWINSNISQTTRFRSQEGQQLGRSSLPNAFFWAVWYLRSENKRDWTTSECNDEFRGRVESQGYEYVKL